MNLVMAWIQASRPPAQFYIAFPLLLGAGAAAVAGHPLSLVPLAVAHLYGLALHLCIVYANDYADAPIDGRNRTYTLFSGGSRVVPEGKLRRADLGRAAVAMAALNLLLAVGASLLGQRPLFLPLVVVSLGLLWAYSFPPAKLSYRGGGEFLQTLGVGVVLPCVGYSMQTGDLHGFPWAWLGFLVPVNLALALATTLPDAPSDRESEKMTFAARFGTFPVRIAVAALLWTGLGAFALGPATADGAWIVVLPMVFAGCLIPLLRDAPPGTRRCAVFVALAVASKVVFTATLAIFLITR